MWYYLLALALILLILGSLYISYANQEPDMRPENLRGYYPLWANYKFFYPNYGPYFNYGGYPFLPYRRRYRHRHRRGW